MSGRGSFGSYEATSYSSYSSGGRDSGNEFNRLMQSVSNNIQKITQNVASLQRMISQVGTTQDSTDLREKLHQIQHYTNQLAKDTSKMIKDMAHLPQPSNNSEQRQRKVQRERLQDEFATALNNFQTTQRQAKEKEKASLQRARQHSSSSYDPFADERRSDDQLTGQSPQQQVIQMEECVDMQLLREREDAIKQLEHDIMDVNDIFKDLGTLVHEQGEVIDSIEAHVDNTQTHVEQGVQQLAKAKNYQSKARRKKIILVVVILVILAIIGLILGLTLGNNNNN